MGSPLAHVFKGTFAHSTCTSPLDVLPGHLLGVEETGKIAFLEPADEQEKLAKKWGFKASEIRELSNNLASSLELDVKSSASKVAQSTRPYFNG